jgi:hypothetical protein
LSLLWCVVYRKIDARTTALRACDEQCAWIEPVQSLYDTWPPRGEKPKAGALPQVYRASIDTLRASSHRCGRMDVATYLL